MANYDGKVVISTELDNGKIPKGIQEVKGALGGLKNVAKSLGATLAAAFSVAAIAGFAKECIELGSNLEEVQNVVDVSFGSMSGMMEEFADSAITQFGMSELAAKKTGSTYMAMAKGLGVAEGAAAEMSLALTGLSGDVASFFNLDQETAAKKLQGIFTGESEALKELGVVMTQTNLKQFALANGMNANIEAMTQAEQVALRYAFVTDALGLAAGDFARTQDSWANQTRILSMQWEQFMGVIGQTLTTVLLPAIKVLNTMVSALIQVAEAIQTVVGGLFGPQTNAVADTNAAIADSALAGAAAEEELAAATTAAGKAAKKALAGFDELTILQSQSGSTSPGGLSAGSSLGSISTGTVTVDGPVEDTLTPKLQAVIDKIHQLIEPLRNIDFTSAIDAFAGLGESVAGYGMLVADHLEWAWFNVLVPLSEWTIEEGAPAAVNTLAAAFELLTTALTPVSNGLQQLWGWLTPVFTFIGETVVSVLENWRELFEKLARVFEEKGPRIEGIFSGLGEIIAVVWSGIEPLLLEMQQNWEQAFDFFGDIAGTTIGYIIDVFYWLIEFFAGIFTGDLERSLNAISGLFESWDEFCMGLFEDVLAAFGLSFEDVESTVKGAVNGIIGFINSMISAVVSGVNTAIRALNRISVTIPDWDVFGSLGGKKFGFNLKTLSTPKIPYLAQGAVLPANKPFLAMVGDQKHGTNVEAPLATIQEAVALVMEDYAASNLAGHEATVAVLREILEAVLGIEIGDEVIGRAVARYNAKMAVVRGNA